MWRTSSRLVFTVVALCLAISVLVGQEPQPPAKPKDLTPEQQEKLKERDRLWAEVEKLWKAEKLAEAVVAAEKMIAIEREVFGKESAEVAESLKTLAVLHEVREDFHAARQARVEVLQILSKRYGEKDWRVADADRSVTLIDQIAKLAPEARRRLAEAKHVAKRADVLKQQNNLPVAISLLRQVLEIRQRLLGEHPDTATSLNNLGFVLKHQGEYRQALDYYQQALAMTQNLYPVERYPRGHPDLAASLTNLGSVFQAQSEYRRAQDFYQRALATQQDLYPADHYPSGHPDLATSLNEMGFVLNEQGEYSRALDYYRQALVMRQKLYPSGHPDLGLSLHQMGIVLKAQGDHGRALDYYQQALAMCQKLYPAERYPSGHPHLAASLNSLGVALKAQGDHGRALDYYKQALAMIQKLYPAESYPHGHHDLAVSMHNLGSLLQAQGDYGGALDYHRQALDMFQKLYAAESYPRGHRDLAQILSSLASVLASHKEHGRALEYCQQALAMRQKLYPAELYPSGHPDLVASLDQLGFALKAHGDHGRALDYYQHALDMCQKLYPAERYASGHPDLARSLINLTSVLCAQGDYVRASDTCRLGVNMIQKHLAIAAIGQTEALQLTLGQSLRYYLDQDLSVALVVKKPGPVYQVALTWKGGVTQRQQGLRIARTHPEVAELWRQLESTNRRLTTLWYVVPGRKQQEAWDRQVRKLNADRERLEAALSRISADFRRQEELRNLAPEQLQKALPQDTALVDFLEYTQFRPPKEGKGTNESERRLVGFVVRRDAPVQLVDLGPIEPIGQAVVSWLSDNRRRPLDSEQSPGADLRRLVWEPLEKHLEGAETVLVSPDGALCGLPFGALPGKEPGTYLIEERAVAVVPVPQLLPELLDPREGTEGKAPSLLVVGEVDFGATAGSSVGVADARSAPRGEKSGALPTWGALPGTRPEIVAIKDSFQKRFRQATTTELREADATEAAFRQQAAKHRFLHLATHGFFAPKEIKSALAPKPDDKFQPGDLFQHQGVIGWHPGLLSGLVLAGANRTPEPDKDDGILTALEVAVLDLSNVELAVLSACETGLGEVAGGEGVLGLQRAFQVAGAKTVIATLWQVRDDAARSLMIDFYDNLWRKKMSKAEALRQAQITMLREGVKRGLGSDEKDKRLPPYYWAGFVLSGDWR